jgi:serine/threonine protein kinase
LYFWLIWVFRRDHNYLPPEI